MVVKVMVAWKKYGSPKFDRVLLCRLNPQRSDFKTK
jgi:hypothetical protein